MNTIEDFTLLNSLNTSIRVDAKRYGIGNLQLMDLAHLYYQNNGKCKPRNLFDLLKVVE
jgi:hypothetical protein